MHMLEARSNSTLTRLVRAQVATKLKTGRAAEVSAAPTMLRQISDELRNTLAAANSQQLRARERLRAQQRPYP